MNGWAHQENLQDILWGLNNPWYWGCMAAAACVGTVCLFIYLHRLVKAQDGLDALAVGRLMWLGAMVITPFQGLNSGILFVSYALFMLGGSLMAFLVVTGWCHRRGTMLQKCGAIWREVFHKQRNREMAGD